MIDDEQFLVEKLLVAREITSDYKINIFTTWHKRKKNERILTIIITSII